MTTSTDLAAPSQDALHDSQTPGESPASSAFAGRGASFALGLALLVALGVAAYLLHENGNAPVALSLMFGATFGAVAQRSRFCFYCNFRDWFDYRDARGLLGLITALAVGLIGTTLVFGAWLPDASTGRLPPDAFIGPVSLALVAAGLAFGAGMSISGSCVSAHLYRLGEGSPTAPFALIGTLIGFALGFMTWNAIYTDWISEAPVVWLPQRFGYAGALLLALGALGVLSLVLMRAKPRRPLDVEQPRNAFAAVVITRWPAWIGGAIIGALATMSYLRVAPIGVTAELGSRARQLATSLNLAPSRLDGLDQLRGCIAVVRDVMLSNNGAFILAIVVAAFATALAAGQFKPAWPTAGQIVRGLIGGALLGWGAMTGLGCTVGTLLSGITAGALSGWVFGAAIFIGSAVTLVIGRKLRALPAA